MVVWFILTRISNFLMSTSGASVTLPGGGGEEGSQIKAEEAHHISVPSLLMKLECSQKHLQLPPSARIYTAERSDYILYFSVPDKDITKRFS